MSACGEEGPDPAEQRLCRLWPGAPGHCSQYRLLAVPGGGCVLPQNQSMEIKMSLHSGLWRVCFLAGEERGRCFTIEYVMPMNSQMTSESTVNVLKMIRSATPFPLVSLFFMFIGFILSNIGHIRPHRTILAFVSGIFFILSGLSLVVGLCSTSPASTTRCLIGPRTQRPISATSMAGHSPSRAFSFLLTESAGVMSVYLFMKRYTAEDMYRPHPGFYRPRLSNCSDYSGQFLHPEAWVRGRSPSDISSDASLQMNSNYPALLKCPDYDQMSSSPAEPVASLPGLWTAGHPSSRAPLLAHESPAHD
uniref:Calcium voltage-gated channel auxiliary subunit gamma 5 n=1 Tax=Rhinolophus ferrumequinum TaxID=59479 RepID=A0A671E586_RHIFE